MAKLEVGLIGERARKALGVRSKGAVARITEKMNRAATYDLAGILRTALAALIDRCSRYSRTSLLMINPASSSAGMTAKDRDTAPVPSRQIDEQLLVAKEQEAARSRDMVRCPFAAVAADC